MGAFLRILAFLRLDMGMGMVIPGHLDNLLLPKESKYQHGTYIDPRVRIWEALSGPCE